MLRRGSPCSAPACLVYPGVQQIRTTPAAALQYTEIGATIVTVDLIIMWLFFALVGRSSRRIAGTARGQRRLDISFGLLFIGVGVVLVFR